MQCIDGNGDGRECPSSNVCGDATDEIMGKGWRRLP